MQKQTEKLKYLCSITATGNQARKPVQQRVVIMGQISAPSATLQD